MNRHGKSVKIWKTTQSCKAGAAGVGDWVERATGTLQAERLAEAGVEAEEVVTGSQTRGLRDTASLVVSLAWAD